MAARRRRTSPIGVIGRTAASWRRLAPFLGGSTWMLLLLAGISVTAGLVEAGLLALIAAIGATLSMEGGTVAADLGPLNVSGEVETLLAVGFGLALARAALHVTMAYLPATMSANAMADLRRRLFDSFTATAWRVQAAERDGHFQSLMLSHVEQSSKAIITLGQGLSAGLMFLTLLASAFVLSLTTAVMLIGASVVLFLLMHPISRRVRRHAQSLSSESVEHSKGMQEIVRMAEETQVFGASQQYRDEIHRLIEQVREPMQRTRFYGRLAPALYQSVALLMLLVALTVVTLLGASQLTALAAVVLILIRSLNYGQNMQTAITTMDELLPFMTRLRESIDHYTANPRQDGDDELPAIRRFGMRDVHFAYQPGEPVLRGLDFDIEAGEAIGIVGPSGAGKSTIVQLLLRLRDPDQGMLHVNDEDARRYRRADWQRRVAYVPQSPQLIWGTVADNIRYYRAGISDDEVVGAAKRAHIHDEILSWPQGYETVVGERASAVSGGQRQRLTLARALAGNPDVLILDEPTSALDVRSEEQVQESLRGLRGDVIMFLVAHRLSTLSVCNRVMVVVDGRLQAIDRPDVLLETNAFYREAIEITRRQSAL